MVIQPLEYIDYVTSLNKFQFRDPPKTTKNTVKVIIKMHPKDLIRNIRLYNAATSYVKSSVWPTLRRSSVLIVLFIGNFGELRVLLTKRSRSLNNFSGHVSLPGGKVDHADETAYDCSRRESFEEIGLPYDEELADQGLHLEYLNSLPCYLSRTFLSVSPIVCFLKNKNKHREWEKVDNLKLLLNPGETSSVFSVPLLDLIDKNQRPNEYIKKSIHSYKWGNLKWPLKHFYYPSINPNEISWLKDIEDLSSDDESFVDDMSNTHKSEGIKDLWGLTAQMLYDLAQISVDKVSSYVGNENLIYGLYEFGNQMNQSKRTAWESGMIVSERGYTFNKVLPKHVFDSISKEFKL